MTSVPSHKQFGLLGVGCASAAVALYEGVRISEIVLRPLPRMVSAPLAGALCGAIAYKFPQVNVPWDALCGAIAPGECRVEGRTGDSA